MVTLPDKTVLEVPYAHLNRPTVSLWELSAASAYLRKAGKTAITEALLFDAVEKQRILIAKAKQETRCVNTKQARTENAAAQRHAPATSTQAANTTRPPEPNTITPSPGVDYSKPAGSYPVEIWFPETYERP
jgi:putative transposase